LEGFVVNCFKTFAIRFRCDSFCWSFQPDHGGTENTEDARRFRLGQCRLRRALISR
jgi:hypothetical protein